MKDREDMKQRAIAVHKERMLEGRRIGEEVQREARTLVLLNEALKEDALIYSQKAIEADTLTAEERQLWRRATVRAAFAEMEALIYQFKRIALAARLIPGVDFAPGEVALLREESYELEENGAIKVRNARLTFKSNLRFAFSAFSRATFSPFVLDVTGRGWQDLRDAVILRDRLTHPKSVENLQVTDREWASVLGALIWFRSSVTEMLQLSPFTRAMEQLNKWILAEDA